MASTSFKVRKHNDDPSLMVVEMWNIVMVDYTVDDNNPLLIGECIERLVAANLNEVEIEYED